MRVSFSCLLVSSILGAMIDLQLFHGADELGVGLGRDAPALLQKDLVFFRVWRPVSAQLTISQRPMPAVAVQPARPSGGWEQRPPGGPHPHRPAFSTAVDLLPAAQGSLNSLTGHSGGAPVLAHLQGSWAISSYVIAPPSWLSSTSSRIRASVTPPPAPGTPAPVPPAPPHSDLTLRTSWRHPHPPNITLSFDLYPQHYYVLCINPVGLGRLPSR